MSSFSRQTRLMGSSVSQIDCQWNRIITIWNSRRSLLSLTSQQFYSQVFWFDFILSDYLVMPSKQPRFRSIFHSFTVKGNHMKFNLIFFLVRRSVGLSYMGIKILKQRLIGKSVLTPHQTSIILTKFWARIRWPYQSFSTHLYRQYFNFNYRNIFIRKFSILYSFQIITPLGKRMP